MHTHQNRIHHARALHPRTEPPSPPDPAVGLGPLHPFAPGVPAICSRLHQVFGRKRRLANCGLAARPHLLSFLRLQALGKQRASRAVSPNSTQPSARHCLTLNASFRSKLATGRFRSRKTGEAPMRCEPKNRDGMALEWERESSALESKTNHTQSKYLNGRALSIYTGFLFAVRRIAHGRSPDN